MRTYLTKDNKSSLFALALSLFVLGWIAIDLIVHYQGLYLILFSLIYVLLPGFLFVITIDHYLCDRFQGLTPVITFFSGFSLLIIQYFLLNAIGALSLIRFSPLFISILLFIASRDKLKLIKWKTAEEYLMTQSAPYSLLLALITVSSYYVFLHTVPDNNSNIFIDFCYHLGNVNILTRAGSFEDTRLMGEVFKYHYFADLYYGILRQIFPATIWNCILRYPILLVPPLICNSTFCLIQHKSHNRIISLVVSILVILFPSLSPTSTLLTYHILTNINSVGLGLPLAICIVVFLSKAYCNDHLSYSDLILLFLLTLCLSGIKGPFTLGIIGATMIFFIYCSIDKKRISLFQLLSLVTIIIAFSVIWFTLLNSAVNEQNITSDKTGMMRFFQLNISMPSIPLTKDYAPDSKHAILFIPISLLYTFGGAAIPFLILILVLIIDLFRKKLPNRDHLTVLCTICGATGIGADYLLALGRNRVYFLMLAAPFVYYSAVALFDIALKNCRKLISYITIILLLFCGYFASQTIIRTLLNPFYVWGTGSLSQDEIDAIDWIRINTDSNALFAINTPSPNGKQYYYSAFTERQFYIESYSYAMNSGKTADDLVEEIETNNELYYNEYSLQIAQDLGIDYLIYYVDSNSIPESLDNNYNLCYYNDTVRVYSVT